MEGVPWGRPSSSVESPGSVALTSKRRAHQETLPAWRRPDALPWMPGAGTERPYCARDCTRRILPLRARPRRTVSTPPAREPQANDRAAQAVKYIGIRLRVGAALSEESDAPPLRVSAADTAMRSSTSADPIATAPRILQAVQPQP